MSMTTESEGYLLHLGAGAGEAGGAVTGQTTGEFVASCDRVLAATLGVRVRSDSGADVLPDGMVRVRRLAGLGAEFREVLVPYSVTLGAQCAREGLGVDVFVAGLERALRVVWGRGVRVFLDHCGAPVTGGGVDA